MPKSHFYVRPLEERDIPSVLRICRRTLANDPLTTYICGSESDSEPSSPIDSDIKSTSESAASSSLLLRIDAYVTLLLSWARSKGGAVDVVCTRTRVDSDEDGDEDGTEETEVVAGVAAWCPSNRRLGTFSWRGLWSCQWASLEALGLLYRLGVYPAKRLLFDYPAQSSDSWKRVIHVDPSLRLAYETSWSLELMVTDVGYHKRGLESMLLQAHKARSAVGGGPGALLLEATTIFEMKYFRELGFELTFLQSSCLDSPRLDELFDRFKLDLAGGNSDEPYSSSSVNGPAAKIEIFSMMQLART
ncbi:hypothetical protein CC1G_15264 [Coprinopsis cinerea okayama7|uniref:N-acetyltransferase domain-containing protein n=1 Tax=Coprinopsis cinerea (strain Okayama-7 / 130 / ATCC MYA-4618 / FGSC 9003) TaxID=240176 RepID=D6RPW3_COPC7|nr:hypothetical protein CC1G_15264 [Coprinopsis cinerea okayama7\|eukprot:XP_002910356.1 hypothetical protein CC1G_15264 [Coprinopsis cinerea okayama7\